MPRKTEDQTAPVAQQPEQEVKLTPFSFPTVGDGITVFAKNIEEAIEMVAKIRADLEAAKSAPTS